MRQESYQENREERFSLIAGLATTYVQRFAYSGVTIYRLDRSLKLVGLRGKRRDLVYSSPAQRVADRLAPRQWGRCDRSSLSADVVAGAYRLVGDDVDGVLARAEPARAIVARHPIRRRDTGRRSRFALRSAPISRRPRTVCAGMRRSVGSRLGRAAGDIRPVTAASDRAPRLLSLDVFRGLVMLVLVPNVYGGFSFYEMAARDPQSPVWPFLARQFTRAQLSGCTIWDLVMPSFVFMIGVAIPYSYAARKGRGESDAWIFAHAVFRAVVLLVLGVELQMTIQTRADLLWPFLILAVGLPVPALIARRLGVGGRDGERASIVLWWGTIVVASVFRLSSHVYQMRGIAFHDILPQVGLGYVFAFIVSRYALRVRALTALAILFAFWLAFLIFPLPGPGFSSTAVGVAPGDELFLGYFAHWNKNTNLAAAFDRWFLNLFPTTEPFAFNTHGYETLNFIPTIVTMVLGTIAGDYLRGDRPRVQTRNGLLTAGGFGVFGGLMLGWAACPIVKSIWTPSWTIFSAGLVTVALGCLYHVVDVRGYHAWTLPFVVAGLNPILLYTLARHSRWPVVEVWRRGLGPALFAGYWGPVLESVACGLSLWLVAYAAYRLKLFVRI